MTSGPVGVSVQRVDGADKVTGRARYVDDLPRMEGELYGATVRSRCARGRLRSVERDPAFDWSGVVFVTAADVPQNVVQLLQDDQPVLAADAINHLHEPVALLACADRSKLERALAAVSLQIDELPAVLEPEQALSGQPVIWGSDNVQSRYLVTKGRADVGDGNSQAAIAAAIADCEVVLSGRYSTTAQSHVYLETQGMIAWWDERGVHVTGSLQCPYFVLEGFARCFDLPAEQIHVTAAVTGGGFGGKEEYPTLLALHAALLANKAGHPIRMIYSRAEDMAAATRRHPSVTDITTGCDHDGTLRALELRTVFDAGAYVTLTPVVLSRGVLHAGGAYRWEHARIEGLSVATNAPPYGAFRGFGAPQTIWAIERHLDRLARHLGREPGELKRTNLLGEGDTTPTGQVLRGSVGGQQCVERAWAASGYPLKRAAGPCRRGRKVRGVGCSIYMHGAGFTGSGEQRLAGKVEVELQPGGRLLVRSASTDIGQGSHTVLAQIAAQAAGLNLAQITLAPPSTSSVPDSGPTVASRTTMVVGAIVQEAATEVAAQVRAVQGAGEPWDKAADRLLAERGVVKVLRQYRPPAWVSWDEDRYRGDAYPVYAWACDVAEVEVDLDTFEIEVLDFWIAADVGKAIHPVGCVGQLEGGTLQAIGWALSEQVVMEGGGMANARLANYIVPTARDAPLFHTILVEQPYVHGPGGGAKGIGELPMDGGAPAIAAAVEHATGLSVDELPLTPERLLERALAQGVVP